MEAEKIFFTGGTSGLGRVAVLEMAGLGHHLFVLVRDPRKGLKLLEDFKRIYTKSKGSIEIIQGDLCSMESLQSACNKLKTQTDSIDQLILNAGVWNFEFVETKDGLEEIFQVNLLAPYYLIKELNTILKKNGNSKIILTSSGLHQGTIHFDDLEFRAKYSGFKAYRQSKLGVILITKYFAQLLEQDEIGVVCQHPGFVSTQLGRNSGWFAKWFFTTFGKNVGKGAQNLLFLMKKEAFSLKTGEYYANRKVKKTSKLSNDDNLRVKLIQKLDKMTKNV
jgi:NAD(P)-dependent dehydrogenase (short-subunit alcohol dehydrogenase family)